MSRVDGIHAPRAEGPGRALAYGSWAVLAILALVLAGALAWRLTGGSWERVETPSMGTRAPVGTLLLVKPVAFESLDKGDFITFRPPGHPELTYSHLVKKVTADGTLKTGGVISGNDPWRIGPDHLVGEVRHTWKGVGWLLKMAPVLVIGGFLVWGLLHLVRGRWRLPTAIVGSALVVSLALVIYQPLTRAEQLAFGPLDGGGARATYVTTGLLPMELASWDGAESVVMKPGEVGTVEVHKANDDGEYSVEVTPAIPLWFWITMILLCFSPALWALVFGVRDSPDPSPEPT